MKKGVIYHSNRKMQMTRCLPRNISDVSQNYNSDSKYIHSNGKDKKNYDLDSNHKRDNSSVDNTSHSRMASLHRADSILHRGKLSKAHS